MLWSGSRKAPVILMVCGFIPFPVLTGAVMFWSSQTGRMHLAAFWLLVHAAMILSFLGGVHWGVEITRREKPRFGVLGPSVLGALAGWSLVIAALQFGIQVWIITAMASMHGLHYLYDRLSTDPPLWYRKYRAWPTAGVMSCLVLVALTFARL